MKKYYVVLLCALILAPHAACAAEKNEQGQFIGTLRAKTDRLVPQKKLSSTTAVGGVRGAPVETADVYWKGEAHAIDPAELAAFQKALSLAEGGKKTEAAAAFAAFAKTYPDSPLRKDADQAVKVLQSP
jgi:TolA-binding protein